MGEGKEVLYSNAVAIIASNSLCSCPGIVL